MNEERDRTEGLACPREAIRYMETSATTRSTPAGSAPAFFNQENTMALQQSSLHHFTPPTLNPSRNGTKHGGSAPAPVPTDDLIYSVPRRAYLFRNGDGRWDLRNPLTARAARLHLRALGATPKHARAVLSDDLLKIVHGETCSPGEPAVIRRGDRLMLNTYVPPQIQPRPGSFPTIALLLKVVTGGEVGAVEHLLNWFAFKAQNPARRNMTSVILQGDQGVGKTLLCNIIAEIIGSENTATLNPGDLLSEFNGHFATKLLVTANEFSDEANPEGTTAVLKTYITDPRVITNTKYVKQQPVENCMSWLITTNSRVPIRLSKDDRRHSVFEARHPGFSSYGRLLGELFVPSGGWSPRAVAEIAAFGHELLRYPVDEQRVMKPFENPARRTLIEASRAGATADTEKVESQPTSDPKPQKSAENKAGDATKKKITVIEIDREEFMARFPKPKPAA